MAITQKYLGLRLMSDLAELTMSYFGTSDYDIGLTGLWELAVPLAKLKPLSVLAGTAEGEHHELLSHINFTGPWANALSFACIRGHLKLAKLAIEYRADSLDHGMYEACRRGHIDIAKLLLPYNPQIVDLAFLCACREGHLDIVKLMVTNGVNLWKTGLIQACNGGNVGVIKFMLENGARDVNSGFGDACANGRIDAVKFLIANGANDWHRGLYEACYQLQIIKNEHQGIRTPSRDIMISDYMEIIGLMIVNGATICPCGRSMAEHLAEGQD